MKPTSSPIDITNQKRGLVGSAADGMRDFSAITVGTIPAISRFIDSSSDMNVSLSARRYEPPAMSRMNSAWKIVQPKAKPRMYSRTTSTKPARPKTPREHRAGEDADAVAGDAMHRRSQRLPPARGDVAFVQTWQRLAAAEHVQERTDHAGIRGQQHEPPFEHRGFRRGADVHRHEQERRRGEHEPQQHHAIQHRALPGVATRRYRER